MKAEDLDLILRALEDGLSPEESRDVQRLLDASPEARAEMAQFRQVRGLVAAHGGGAFSPAFADRVVQRAAHPRTARRADRLAMPPRRRLLAVPALGWTVAAAVLVGAVLLTLALRPQTVQVPYGERTTVDLPDGSTVELGSGSILRYGRFWGRAERKVSLQGEAFFDVAHGTKPFVVQTFNARVVVKGTTFNVRAWPRDLRQETAVTLASGRVELVPRAPKARPVLLSPGETSYVRGDTALAYAPVRIPLDRALAWRSGGLAFVDQPLQSVFNTLERHFDVDITLAVPEAADLPLTYLNPRPRSAAEVLSDICHAHRLHFQRTANGFKVFRPAERPGADPARPGAAPIPVEP